MRCRQSLLDVERLHKAAERIAIQQDALDDALERLDIAAQGLRIIATWAKVAKQDDIHTRAMDVLRVIGRDKM